jgi:hypothetical protein
MLLSMALLMNSGVEIVGLVGVAPVVRSVVADCAKAGALIRAQVVARAIMSFMAYS